MAAPRTRGGGIPLFRIGPIAVVADFSWFLALAFFTWYFAEEVVARFSPQRGIGFHLGLGFLGALALFGSVLVHELSHSAVSWAYGKPVRRIRLFVFGGVSELSEEPDRPLHEFLIAVAGPATSFLVAGILYGLARATGGSDGGAPQFREILRPARGEVSPVATLFAQISVTNLLLGVFNLLPGFPLDGGRCLRAALWARTGDLLRATRTASRCGKALAALLVGLGAWSTFESGWPGLWIALIGFFLHGAASSAYHSTALRASFGTARVEDVMVRSVIGVEPGLPLDRLVADYFLRYRYRAFPVVEDGRVLGVISMSNVSRVPREVWPRTLARDAARGTEGIAVDPADPLYAAFRRMGETGLASLPVIRDGRLVGMIARRDILLALLARGGPASKTTSLGE